MCVVPWYRRIIICGCPSWNIAKTMHQAFIVINAPRHLWQTVEKLSYPHHPQQPCGKRSCRARFRVWSTVATRRCGPNYTLRVWCLFSTNISPGPIQKKIGYHPVMQKAIWHHLHYYLSFSRSQQVQLTEKIILHNFRTFRLSRLFLAHTKKVRYFRTKSVRDIPIVLQN